MSRSSDQPGAPADRCTLVVRTSDAQSEIMVLDGKGRLVDRALGPEHTFQLESGIYRVKVLTGSESEEKPVVLTRDLRAPLEFGAVAFPSPVPLIGTTTSHEYHLDAAQRESKKTHVADGAGSSLFFLVRHWTPQRTQAPRPRISRNPAAGLS